MTDRQEDQLTMFRTLLAIRALFAALIAAIADLDGDFDDLATAVAAIKAQLQKQKLQTKGIATDKDNLVHDLVTMATMVAGAVMAFASKAGNNTLLQEVKYSQSTLEHLRDEELPEICRIIHDRANTNLAALAGRGITAGVLNDFMNLITGLEDMNQAPRTATTKKSTATTDMSAFFAEANKIIKERLDGGMKIFIPTNNDVYLTYRNGRKIVDTGHRKKKDNTKGSLEFNITDAANGNPLDGALVSIADRLVTSDEDGNGKINGIIPGTYTVTIVKPGYQEHTNNGVSIIAGESTTLNIQLLAEVTPGTVDGTVTQGGNPVSANVTADGQAGGTTTDPFGNFSFSVPGGPQTIRATKISNPAESVTQNITVIPGVTSTINLVFA